MTRALAITTLRNEGAFLLDWLAHHRAVGFTEFLVFSNDCTDGTDTMLDRLQAMGLLTHIRNNAHGEKGPQWTALRLADQHPMVAAADWIMVFDIDEYLAVHVGGGTLADLWAAMPQATAIPVTWRMFGNAGVVEYADMPVWQTFTRAAPSVLHWPWRAQHFKTLFRNDGAYRKLGVHRPRNPEPDRLAGQCWINGSGNAMDASFHRNGVFSPLGEDHHRIAQLNHYALGAMESYVLKCDRGRANREGMPFDMGYWIERNFSDDEDRRLIDGPLSGTVAGLRAQMAADSVLASLHAGAVAWRHARFAALMLDEPVRALFGRLRLTGPSQVLTRVEAQTIWQPKRD
jgi:Glycosyl transferase family 2